MISLSHGLSISIILFFLGMTSFIIRRNVLFTLISIEIMFNSIALALSILSIYWQDVNGQIMYLIIVTCAASDSAIGLALLLQLYRHHKTLNIDLLSEMKK